VSGLCVLLGTCVLAAGLTYFICACDRPYRAAVIVCAGAGLVILGVFISPIHALLQAVP
jgi:hypothetical protein